MIDKIEIIIRAVILGVSLLYALITTVMLIRGRIKRAHESGNTNYVEQLLTELPSIWCEVENNFKSCFGELKTGAFKLNYALSILRDRCDGYGIKFDKIFWEQQLANLTTISKVNGSSETVQDSDKKIIQGVNYEG